MEKKKKKSWVRIDKHKNWVFPCIYHHFSIPRKKKGAGYEDDLNTTSASTSLFGSKSDLFPTNAITAFWFPTWSSYGFTVATSDIGINENHILINVQRQIRVGDWG